MVSESRAVPLAYFRPNGGGRIDPRRHPGCGGEVDPISSSNGLDLSLSGARVPFVPSSGRRRMERLPARRGKISVLTQRPRRPCDVRTGRQHHRPPTPKPRCGAVGLALCRSLLELFPISQVERDLARRQAMLRGPPSPFPFDRGYDPVSRLRCGTSPQTKFLRLAYPGRPSTQSSRSYARWVPPIPKGDAARRAVGPDLRIGIVRRVFVDAVKSDPRIGKCPMPLLVEQISEIAARAPRDDCYPVPGGRAARLALAPARCHPARRNSGKPTSRGGTGLSPVPIDRTRSILASQLQPADGRRRERRSGLKGQRR